VAVAEAEANVAATKAAKELSKAKEARKELYKHEVAAAKAEVESGDWTKNVSESLGARDRADELFSVRAELIEERATRVAQEELIVELKKNFRSLDTEATTTTRALAESEAEVDRLNTQLQMQAATFKSAPALLTAVEDSEKEKDSLEAELDQVSRELEAIMSEHQIAVAALQAETSVRQAAQGELLDVDSGLSSLESLNNMPVEPGMPMKSRIRAFQSLYEDAGTNQLSLQANLSKVEAELEEVKVSLAKLEAANEELTAAKSSAEAVCDQLTAVCEKLNSEKMEVEAEAATMSSECEQFSCLLEEANAELVAAQGDPATAEALAEAEEEAKDLLAKLNTALASEAETKESLAQLEEQVRLEKLEERGQAKLVELTDRAECAEKKCELLEMSAEKAKDQIEELTAEVGKLKYPMSPPSSPAPAPAAPGANGYYNSPLAPVFDDALSVGMAAHANIMAALTSESPARLPLSQPTAMMGAFNMHVPTSPGFVQFAAPPPHPHPPPVVAEAAFQEWSALNQALQARVMDLESEVNVLSEKLVDATATIRGFENARALGGGALEQCQSDLKRKTHEADILRKEKMDIKSELMEYRSGRVEAQAELRACKIRLESSDQAVSDANAETDALEKEIPKLQERLKATMHDLEEAKGEATKAVEMMESNSHMAAGKQELIASLEEQIKSLNESLQSKDDALFNKEEMIRGFLYSEKGSISTIPGEDGTDSPARKSVADRVKEHRMSTGESVASEHLSSEEHRALRGMNGQAETPGAQAPPPTAAPMGGAMASMVERSATLEAENAQLRCGLLEAKKVHETLAEAHFENDRLSKVIVGLNYEVRKAQAVAGVMAGPPLLAPPSPVPVGSPGPVAQGEEAKEGETPLASPTRPPLGIFTNVVHPIPFGVHPAHHMHAEAHHMQLHADTMAVPDAARIQHELAAQANKLALKERPTPKRVFLVDGLAPVEALKEKEEVKEAERWDGTLSWDGKGFLNHPGEEQPRVRNVIDSVAKINMHYRTGITEAFLAGESPIGMPQQPAGAQLNIEQKNYDKFTDLPESDSIGRPHDKGTFLRHGVPPTELMPDDFHQKRGAGNPDKDWMKEAPKNDWYASQPGTKVDGILDPQSQQSLLDKHLKDPTLSLTNPTALLGIHMGIAETDPRPGEASGAGTRVSRVIERIPMSMMTESLKKREAQSNGTESKPTVFST